MLFLFGSILFLLSALGVFFAGSLGFTLNETLENSALIISSLLSGLFFALAQKKSNSKYKEEVELISKDKLNQEVLEDQNKQLEQKIKTLEAALERLS